MPDSSAAPETRTNTVLNGRLTLHQPAAGYRAAIDPVLLAAAAPAQADMQVLDAGCGVGTAGLCLMERVAGLRLTGIDIQDSLVALARRNATDNDHTDACRFYSGDISTPPDTISAQAGQYDLVISNPPYLDANSYSPSPNAIRSTANATAAATPLSAWIGFAAQMLKPRGRFVMIHRADHLPRILSALTSTSFGDIRIFPLWPRAGRPAKRVLIGAATSSKAPAVVLPGMVLHEGETDQAYTQAARSVLYDAAGIDLWP